MIKTNLKYYKRKVTFGLIICVCFVLALTSGAQVALMYAFEEDTTEWQGICKGGELSNGGDRRTNMMVHCPGEEEFVINDPYVIIASKSEGKVFYCRRTKGTIIKNETWKCYTSDPKGES